MRWKLLGTLAVGLLAIVLIAVNVADAQCPPGCDCGLNAFSYSYSTPIVYVKSTYGSQGGAAYRSQGSYGGSAYQSGGSQGYSGYSSTSLGYSVGGGGSAGYSGYRSAPSVTYSYPPSYVSSPVAPRGGGGYCINGVCY